jgi:probable rRNA maturation factor
VRRRRATAGAAQRGGAIDVSAARGFASHAARVKRVARRALEMLDAAGDELSIALVDDDAIRSLNRDYRGKDRPTDVLAFAQLEGETAAKAPSAAPRLLGDVVISVPTAARQAANRHRRLELELTTLAIHGILHLLGYDHERSPADARRMFKKAREIEQSIDTEPRRARTAKNPSRDANRRRSGAASTEARSPGKNAPT